MLSNGEFALSWPWEEQGKISSMVVTPHCIPLESDHKVWKDCIFCIPKKVISVEDEIIEERVRQALFAPAWGLYRNTHFSVPKKNGKYRFIIYGVSANQPTVEDARIPSNIKEFSEAFARLHISSPIDFDSGYGQKMLPKDSWDYMNFQFTQDRYRRTRLVQGATNSVLAILRVS